MTTAEASSAPAAASVTEDARAKINLTLHVTGRRPDGYHLLDSLVVFAGDEAADRIAVRQAEALSLSVQGPRAAGVPEGPENLVLRAAVAAGCPGAAITLHKVLPAASGIGGGSADAAATLRALALLWQTPLPDPGTVLALGADVPVCLDGRATRMAGIGERLTPATSLPPLPAVLVNPGVEVSTPAVFAALERRDNPPMPDVLPRLIDPPAAARWLATQRNDLEAPARRIAPPVAHAIAALEAETDCLLARMSGSGATCFGLFPDRRAADTAAASLSAAHPDWWVVATVLT